MRSGAPRAAGRGRLSVFRVLCAWCVLVFPGEVAGQALTLLNVPYLSQSEALCGGAAAAMVLRFWGARDLTAESFEGLVDRSASGIRTDTLQRDIESRGWNARAVEGDSGVIARELAQGRPAIALIEDRPGTYHYVVVVGLHERGVVLHDPARVPFRVMPPAEFSRRWRATREWALLITPRLREAEAVSLQPPLPSGPEGDRCDGLVRQGIADARAGAFDAAEQSLTAALGCPGITALTELAGLRLLQRRFTEVVELSSRAVDEDPSATHAWELLAAGRFVSDDPRGALEAWNVAGQPRFDLFRVEGLERTDQKVVERLAGLRQGQVLTVPRLRRAERQLRDWPGATSVGTSYVPRPGGLADVRVAVVERELFPRRLVTLAVVGGRALVTREVKVALGALTRGGDRLEVGWRFWPGRPRLSAGLLAPAPWGGLWGVQASTERQPVSAPASLTVARDSADLVLSAWQSGSLRWQAGAGVDRWLGSGRYASLNGLVSLVSQDDRARLHVRSQQWFGRTRFGTWDVLGRASQPLARGYWLEGRAAWANVSREAPLDMWAAGDNGQVRSTLLRAHPLVRRGTFAGPRLGTRVATMSVELQRLYETRGARFGPAAFVDVGRTAGRLSGGSVVDSDVGVGFRASVAGMPGTVRVDIAKGLRDGATALSFIYEP